MENQQTAEEKKTAGQEDGQQKPDEKKSDELLLDDLFGAEEKPEEKKVDQKPEEKAGGEEDKSKDLQNLFSSHQQASDKKSDRQFEVIQFFNSEEGKLYQPYARQIAKVATDPRFIGLPMDRVIGLTLTPKILMQIGAKMSAAADEQTKRSTTGGNSGGGNNSNTITDKKAWDMDTKEFQQIKENALRGKYKTA